MGVPLSTGDLPNPQMRCRPQWAPSRSPIWATGPRQSPEPQGSPEQGLLLGCSVDFVSPLIIPLVAILSPMKTFCSPLTKHPKSKYQTYEIHETFEAMAPEHVSPARAVISYRPNDQTSVRLSLSTRSGPRIPPNDDRKATAPIGL